LGASKGYIAAHPKVAEAVAKAIDEPLASSTTIRAALLKSI
jgi:hypothetical protein